MSKKDISDWNLSAMKRKEFRHTHNGPEVPKHIGKRKNTRKWCKGKVGREHQWHRDIDRNFSGFGWVFFRWNCAGCGKKHWGDRPR